MWLPGPQDISAIFQLYLPLLWILANILHVNAKALMIVAQCSEAHSYMCRTNLLYHYWMTMYTPYTLMSLISEYLYVQHIYTYREISEKASAVTIQQCILLGYPQNNKAWLFYYPWTKKTIFSNSADVDEWLLPDLSRHTPYASPHHNSLFHL